MKKKIKNKKEKKRKMIIILIHAYKIMGMLSLIAHLARFILVSQKWCVNFENISQKAEETGRAKSGEEGA